MPTSPSSFPLTKHRPRRHRVRRSKTVGGDLARRRQLGWHPDNGKCKRAGIVEPPRDALGIVGCDCLDQGVALIEEVVAEAVLLKLVVRASDPAGRVEFQSDVAGEEG